MKPARLLLVCFLLLIACVTATSSVGGTWITVEVSNQNWRDATVYALCGSAKIARLGPLSMGRSARKDVEIGGCPTFRLGWHLGGTSRQNIRLTDPLLVSPGSTVRLKIENHEALSTWKVAG